jgi:hypothetical protein
LINQVDQPRQLGYPADSLDPNAVDELAVRLKQLGKDDLLPILNRVPASWPVSDSELEALGFFLERRAPAVAERLRQMIGGTS